MRDILQLVPRRPRSTVICYSISTGLVGISFLLLLALRGAGGLLGFYVLFPAIVLSAVFLDHGAGLYAAVVISALLYLLVGPCGGWLFPGEFMLPLAVFLF